MIDESVRLRSQTCCFRCRMNSSMSFPENADCPVYLGGFPFMREVRLKPQNCLPILNPSNFVPENGFSVVKALMWDTLFLFLGALPPGGSQLGSLRALGLSRQVGWPSASCLLVPSADLPAERQQC